MKIFQLPDINGILHRVLAGTNGVPLVNSDPGDKIISIYDIYFERVDFTTTGTGEVRVYLPAFTAGYWYTITSLAMYYSGALSGRIWSIIYYYGAMGLSLYVYPTPAASAWTTYVTNLICDETSQVFLYCPGAESSKQVAFCALGYRMRKVSASNLT